MKTNAKESYAKEFRNRTGFRKGSGLLARATLQTSVREGLLVRTIRACVSYRLQCVPQISRKEIRRGRRFHCVGLRGGKTRFSIALGHGTTRSEFGLGKNEWCHGSARSRPGCAFRDLT